MSSLMINYNNLNKYNHLCVCVYVFRVESGVETAFLGTRSGLLRVVRYAGVETRVAK